MTIRARALTEGRAQGRLLKLDCPLSFWGGIDLETGEIIDASHPQQGVCVAARVLAMSAGRGSSSSSSALVELVRGGVAPSAILLNGFDPILVIGSLVARELYKIDVPIVIVSDASWPRLSENKEMSIVASGQTAKIRAVFAK